MKKILKSAVAQESGEDFNMPATVTVMLLLLLFVGASFYILVSGYMSAS